MAYYKETLVIQHSLTEVINGLLTHQPKDQSECQGEDDTIVESVKFSNGFMMDVKCCGVQYEEGNDNTSWTEAVLFDPDGAEIACTDVMDEYLGLWEIEYNGDTYAAMVVDQEKNDFEQKCYEAYQLDWMISHGYALSDLVNILTGIAGAAIEEDPLLAPTDADGCQKAVDEALSQFEDTGFGSGSMYVCKDEFLGAEFLDNDYMYHLLRSMPDPKKKMDFWKKEYGKEAKVPGNWPENLDKIEVKTTVGTIYGEKDTTPGRPGICVTFLPEGADEKIDLSYVSVPEDPDHKIDEKENLQDIVIMTYENVYDEDYTSMASIRKLDIEKCFADEISIRITKEMIEKGYNAGKVQITDVAEEYGCIGTVCKIGDNAFYFGGQEAEDMTAEEYVRNTPREDLINEIFHTLDDEGGIRTEFEDEYRYYYHILKEMKV